MDFIFHADDYGITPEQSRRILECCDGYPGGAGLLNSLSILAGSPRFEECARLLDGRPDGLHVGVHLNFVEGPCCADPAVVPLLVDEKGMFKLGYGGLLAGSWGARSAELRRQLTVEAGAQIARVVGRFPELAGHLRVDGHQHTQLIPAVFDATLEAVRRSGCTLEYLRIPAEPTGAYLRSGVAGTVRPVNWVKHALLNALWRRDRRVLAASGLPSYERVSAVFCGVLFSGHMDQRRVSCVLPALTDEARRRDMSLELLFHPGRVASATECLNPALPGFVEFSCGEGRDVEHDALRSEELRASFEAVCG